MTLLQDLHCLPREREGISESLLANQTLTSLLTASPKHKTQAGDRQKQHLELEMCVEEDSGYQTSDNENETENMRETLNRVHERIQRHARQSFSRNGAEILDLSYQRKGLKRESETLDSEYEIVKRRRTEDCVSLRDEDKAEPQILQSEYEKIQRRQFDNSVDNDAKDYIDEEEEQDKIIKRRQTEDSIPQAARDFEGFGGEEERVPKAELQTEEALANPPAVESFREQKVEITDEEQEEKAKHQTEEALNNPLAVDSQREGDQKEKAKHETEEALNNPLAVESHREGDQKEEFIDEVQEEGTRPQTDSVLANPIAGTPLHSGLLCCTNGFFRSTGGPLSAFESNCGCTTRNLVDWRTRVTWTNSSLCHQVRIREVTVLSPFRTSAIPWGLPGLGLRYCPPPQPVPQYQKPVSLPQKPKTQVRTPQHALRLKKEQQEEEEEEKEDGERGYRCEQVGCGRTFCRNEELTRHLRIHSGQRPYACQRCGRRFVRRDHLTKHQRTHLPAHVKRSYTCPLPACTHRYTRSDALTRHMWTAHHIRARQPPRATTSTTTNTTNHHHRSLNPKLET